MKAFGKKRMGDRYVGKFVNYDLSFDSEFLSWFEEMKQKYRLLHVIITIESSQMGRGLIRESREERVALIEA